MWDSPSPPHSPCPPVVSFCRLGYRHLDCAAEYGNEGEVGEALRLALQQGLVRREGEPGEVLQGW